jgi:hypothetical protein
MENLPTDASAVTGFVTWDDAFCHQTGFALIEKFYNTLD